MALKALDRMTPCVDQKLRPLENLHLLTEELSQMQLVMGNGSPEGVVEARQGREYMDLTGSTGSIKYIKQFSDIGGDKSQGWVLI